MSNLVSGGDAGLPRALALQRRRCWREADAGSGLEERTAGTSELLEDRDSGCSSWAALHPDAAEPSDERTRRPDHGTKPRVINPPGAETRGDSEMSLHPPTPGATLIHWQHAQWKRG